MLGTKEVFLIAALLCLVTYLVLFSVRESRAQIDGIRELLLASILGMAGNILYAFGRELPVLISYELANAVYASGTAAVFVSYRKLFRREPLVAIVSFAVLAVTGYIAVFHYAIDSFTGRTLAASGFQVVLAIGIGSTVLSSAEKWNVSQYPKTFVLSMCVIVAAGHVWRCVHQVLAGDAPQSLLAPNGWNVFFLSAGAFALPVLIFGGLLFAHRKAMQLAENAANRDYLTEALSRRAFFEAGERELARARRTGRPLALLYIDLDNFKSLNDACGHQAGDDVLVSVVSRASARLRAIDLLARIGGDEFAILMPETELAGACIVAERLVEACAFDKSEDCLQPLTLSVGVAVLHKSDTLRSLMKRADAALYAAKAKGRNRVESETVTSTGEHLRRQPCFSLVDCP